ncbi:hypothetical protein [uncultured Salinicola sp.]|uniref:hypothetical protein n=1 Tax=uncultured Salinicola sp. TaxID=1193542 RepID=UPI0026384E20|nr:hypothetical protein [uncultured Salinicola sp.]|tara:strand:- start:4294 stop:4584 length:291 start_codon:yes stop_codon:yes gene_type:complete
MKDKRDLVLVREHDGGHEFILVDTSKGTIPSLEGDRTYNDVVAFPLKDTLRDEGMTYPVVYDDNTIGINRQKAKVSSQAAMPMSVKRRYERWAEKQ